MISFEEKCDAIFEHDRACECCIYSLDCCGGVSGSPNGPIYPPCADCDNHSELLDEDMVEEIYEEIAQEN